MQHRLSFLQDIYYSLGLDKICARISEKYKFDYDLNDILSMLVFSRIIAPGSKLSSFESSRNFLEPPECSLYQVYRSLEVIAKKTIFSSLNFTKIHNQLSKEKRKFFTMTAQTFTSKLRKMMISENMEFQKNTVQIQSFRWDYSWMLMAFLFHSQSLMAIRMSNLQ